MSRRLTSSASIRKLVAMKLNQSSNLSLFAPNRQLFPLNQVKSNTKIFKLSDKLDKIINFNHFTAEWLETK